MEDGPPSLISINHDDYHAKHIGHTSDGCSFILTTPFVPAIGSNVGGEYVALYLFDREGKLLESRIDDLGPREGLDEEKCRQVYEQRLAELGNVTFDDIKVAPFTVERFGATFGLVVREPEDEDDVWAVEMQPGNFMAFFEPWDSGEYDT